MYSDLDRELGKRMFQVARKIPFTNTVSTRKALGLSIPGVPMGDCADQCNALISELADIPGEARLHRAISPTERGPRNGKPGAHVLVHKETQEGRRILDPNFLHMFPFRPYDKEDWIPSRLAGMGRLGEMASVKFTCFSDYLEVVCPFVMKGLGSNATYSFDISPQQAVTATGLENAGRVFEDYILRFVREEDVIQIVFDYFETGEVYWVQGGAGKREMLSLNGVSGEHTRRAKENILREFELDLGQVMDLLQTAPKLAEEFKRLRSEAR